MWHELENWLVTLPPADAVGRLAAELEKGGDLSAWFQACLLAERLRLGLPVVMPADDAELPESSKAAYEDAICRAAKAVGERYLEKGDLSAAWPYFRLIGDLKPLAAALEAERYSDEHDLDLVLHLAIQEQVHPVWGYRLLLQHRGLCSAITTFGQFPPAVAEVRRACVGLLIAELHSELVERLRADLAGRRDQAMPADTPFADLLAAIGHLGDEDFAHVDLSHLASVMQFALELPRSSDFSKLLELCAYGERLPRRWQPHEAPPFDDGFKDYHVYFQILAGIDIEAGLEHFRSKAEALASPELTLPGEVLVHLLAELGRPKEALTAFSRYLAQADRRRLSCVSAEELARRCGDFEQLASLAQRRGDYTGYAAARLASLTCPAEAKDNRLNNDLSSSGLTSPAA